jgi:chorismate mutase
MNTETITETLTSLVKKRAELSDRLAMIKADLAQGLNRDSEEQATQLENYDVLLEIERVTSIELAKVEQKIVQKQAAHS